MGVIRAKVSESGRLQLPAEMRRATGLEHGGEVVVELVGKEIRVRTLQESIARAQELARRILGDTPQASVDDFLATRRRDEAGME